jgi:hypothetical protein
VGGSTPPRVCCPAPPHPLLPRLSRPTPPYTPLQGEAVGGEGGPSFMADVFFLTQLLLHVGPLPSVFR